MRLAQEKNNRGKGEKNESGWYSGGQETRRGSTGQEKAIGRALKI